MSTVISGSTSFSPSITSSESSNSTSSREDVMDVTRRSSVGETESSRDSSSTVSSLMELGWTEDEQFTVERIHRTKRQLEDEIEVSIKMAGLSSQITCEVAEFHSLK